MSNSNAQIPIDVMNVAIALFDGWLPDYGGQGSPFYWKPAGFIPQFALPEQMEYHTSWDCLMSVWKRLKTVVSDESDEDFPAEFCAMCDIWALNCEHVNINGAHKLLYDAIIWYNQQKQNNGITENNAG